MLALTNAQFVGFVFGLAALVVPIWLIIRLNIVGLILGALFFWIVLILGGELLNQLDPERDSAIIDIIWLWAGWLGGLMYCLPIYAIRRVTLLLRRRGAELASERNQG